MFLNTTLGKENCHRLRYQVFSFYVKFLKAPQLQNWAFRIVSFFIPHLFLNDWYDWDTAISATVCALMCFLRFFNLHNLLTWCRLTSLSKWSVLSSKVKRINEIPYPTVDKCLLSATTALFHFLCLNFQKRYFFMVSGGKTGLHASRVAFTVVKHQSTF